jgi:hypothetical protein
MGLGLRTIKTEMKGTGGGRWERRASAKVRSAKARRREDRAACRVKTGT